jgi:hypothetical protein
VIVVLPEEDELTAPPISVVLATTEPWPDLARCLAALGPQVAALGGEIIVGDGHGDALDAIEAAKHPELRLIRMPGASVFELRARAIDAARGEVIAITEDHCVVGGDWCAEILRGFACHPAALALTGPVANGSTERFVDRGNYLFTFGFCMGPCNLAQRERCPVIANVAYRRRALPTAPLPVGWLEFEGSPTLFQQGAFHEWAAMNVTHVQSHGFFRTLLSHFDNGRSTTGLRARRRARPRSPWSLYRGTLRSFSQGADHRALIRSSRGMLIWIACCHSLGELVGRIAGPGASPARLR